MDPLSTGDDDAPLLCGVAAGDEASFRAFYGRYAGRVLSLLVQLCGDRALAEDLLQEVFLQVWRRAETYRPERGPSSSWLFAITRNKVIDHRRRRSSQPADELDVAALADQARPSDARIGLEQALAQLPGEQREAVALAYFGGLTYEETAERLRLPLGTLKSRIRVGLRGLRTVLEERAPS